MTDFTDKKSVLDTTQDDNPIDGPQVEPGEQERDEEEVEETREPGNRRDVRALAFHYVYAVDRNDYEVSLEELVSQYEDHFGVTAEEARYSFDLAQGAIEHRDRLDEEIKPLLENWKLERLGCCTRLILRMALWEMQQPDAIPSIVINEAVELAKGFAEKDAFKFVNGILDEARKRSEQDRDEDDQDDPDEPGEPVLAE